MEVIQEYESFNPYFNGYSTLTKRFNRTIIKGLQQ